MLYTTTRNNNDTFTAQRVLTSRRGPDGGLYVPFRISRLSDEEIMALAEKNFNTNLADCLNRLFSVRLSAYDIDLTIGRSVIRLKMLGQKIVMGECWHNTQWMFSQMVHDISRLLLSDKANLPEIGGWNVVGIRIAVLFGIFGDLIREGIASPQKKIDISLIAGDFSGPIAAWYARIMGLPIGNIVCCCNENCNLWNFICHGQLRTDGIAVRTMVPEGDVVVPEGLEWLIAAYGGPVEAERYMDAVRSGSSYYVEDGFLNRMRQGIYVTVSSEHRIVSTIPSTWSTHHYLLGPTGALSYAGLQDYRARTGALQHALILTETSPIHEKDSILHALGIPEEAFIHYFN